MTLQRAAGTWWTCSEARGQPGRDDQPGPPRPARLHHHDRGLPGFPVRRRAAGRAQRRDQRAPGQARADHGPQVRRPRGPAARFGAQRRQVLHARDDGHGPRHRAQRPVGRRPDQAVRQRALRLGLLSPAHPDVRQDGHGRQRRPFRRGHRRPEGGDRGQDRPRPRHPRAQEAGRHLQKDREAGDRPRLPDGTPRPARRRHPGRVQVLERRARPHLPPPGAHRRKPGDGRQHLLNGVRQPGPQLGYRRRLHPRPCHRRPGRLRRLPRGRSRRGRRRRHPQHLGPPGSRAAEPHRLCPAPRHHEHPRAPLPGPLRHRVHHRKGQALDAADQGGQAHRGCRLPHRRPARGRRHHRYGRSPRAGERGRPGRAHVPPLRREDGHCQPDQGHGRQPRRRRGQGRLRLPHRCRRSGQGRGGHPGRAPRPTPTTCPG